MDQIPQGQQATIVCECPDARIYRLVQNSRTKIFQGVMKLAWLSQSRIYFVNIQSFCQTIFPDTPWVILTSQKGVSLLFPHIEAGLNGIFIPHSEATQLFCNNLANIIQIIPYENAIQIQQFKFTIDTHCSNILSNPLENDSEVVDYIQKGGETLKSGFTWLGAQLASGIEKGGQYINSKVDKQEKVEVSSDTKFKYASAKATASYTVEVTSNFLKDLFKPVVEKSKEVKKDVNTKIDKSDNDCKKITKNLIFLIALKQGRTIAVATWDATANALSGLGTALCSVGDSLGSNTRKVVEKRYGDDVTNTFMGPQQSQQQQYQGQYQK